VTYPLGIQLDPAKVAALCGEPAEPSVPADGVTDDVAGLIGALRRQRQIDEDGTEVGVSRQAVDEAIERLAQLAPLLTENERLRAELARPVDRDYELVTAVGRADRAEAENERLRVQLAGCGVAAMGNTRESLERNRLSPDTYGYSASYGDCLRAAEREIAEREAKETAERDARELRGRVERLAEAADVDAKPKAVGTEAHLGWTQAHAYYAEKIRTALATPSGAPDSGEALDARRYRWLRTAPNENVSLPCVYAYRDKVRACVGGKQLDAAIDAAIAASTEGASPGSND
jgi:hypothetical protein